jgi:hypothetical protein
MNVRELPDIAEGKTDLREGERHQAEIREMMMRSDPQSIRRRRMEQALVQAVQIV